MAVSSISPSAATNDGDVPFTVTGTGFSGTMAVKLTKSGQTDIEATGEVLTGSTTIDGTFPLGGAATGAWDVVVTGTGGGTLTGGFTVERTETSVTIKILDDQVEVRALE